MYLNIPAGKMGHTGMPICITYYNFFEETVSTGINVVTKACIQCKRRKLFPKKEEIIRQQYKEIAELEK